MRKTEIFVPDSTPEALALSRTTRMCIAAHQDDIELMCGFAAVECFEKKDEYFCGVVMSDGAGSPRDGCYADYTDDEMKKVRVAEQKKAAVIGDYGALCLMNFTSKQLKSDEETATKELAELIKRSSPKIIYTHNLADKHFTHIAVVTRVIKAIRSLKKENRPEKLIACEVWRGLDWVNDDEKLLMDCTAHPALLNALMGVFDSQIAGGKRYDKAIEGRRVANATFSESHGVDKSEAVSYAMDLTPLITDDSLSPEEYIAGFIDRFKNSVTENIKKLY